MADDIDALHATWKAAQKVGKNISFTPWPRASFDAWPAIYERLRELEAERDRANERWDTARLALRDAERELRILRNSEAGDIAFAQLREEEATARAEREAALRQAAEALLDRAQPLVARYSETRDSALLDDQHEAEAWLISHRSATAERARTEGER